MAKQLSKHILPVFSLASILLLFFYPLLFEDKMFFFRDFHRIFYPLKFFMANVFQNGAIPYWCPNLFCGSPFASFIPNAVFYPLSAVFLWPDFPVALTAFILLHFVLGFGFFYLFITALGLSRRAAVVTGVSFCFGGYTIATINLLSHLQTLIWLPAILWSLRRAIVQKRPGYYFLTIIFLVMALLAGAPQLFLMMSVLMLPAALTWLPAGADGLRARLKQAAVLPLLLGVSIAIAMVQLGPIYIDYLNSVRFDGISFKDAAAFSMHPAMLRHLLIPQTFTPEFILDPGSLTDFFPGSGRAPWLLTIYPGFLILPLALLGSTRRGLMLARMFWPLVLLVSGLLALGHHTPFFRLFYEVAPSFRYPVKFMFLAGFSLLVTAAYGFDDLMRMCRAKGVSTRRLFSVLLLTLVIDLYSAHRHLNPVSDNAFYRHHHPLLNEVIADSGQHRIYIDRDLPVLTGAMNTIRDKHIQWQAFLAPNLGILQGLSHVGGATGLELKHQFFITELLIKPWPQKIQFLRLANVKYIISTNRLDRFPDLAAHLEPVNKIVYRLKAPLPRAWLAGAVQPVKRYVLDELSRPSFDPRQAVLAWGDLADTYRTPSFQPIERVNYTSANTISIEVDAERPSILFLSESAYPGWRVFVDGIERRNLKLNYLFQGVAVETGRHRVEFVYRPRHFSLFVAISAASTALLLLTGAIYMFRRRKSRMAPTG